MTPEQANNLVNAIIAVQSVVPNDNFCQLACAAKAVVCPTFPEACKRITAAIEEAGCDCTSDRCAA